MGRRRTYSRHEAGTSDINRTTTVPALRIIEITPATVISRLRARQSIAVRKAVAIAVQDHRRCRGCARQQSRFATSRSRCDASGSTATRRVDHLSSPTTSTTTRTVATLYKSRWQISSCSTGSSNALNIRKFMGKNDNAIRLQIISAMIAYLLLRIARRLNSLRMLDLRFAELVWQRLFIRTPITDRQAAPRQPKQAKAQVLHRSAGVQICLDFPRTALPFRGRGGASAVLASHALAARAEAQCHSGRLPSSSRLAVSVLHEPHRLDGHALLTALSIEASIAPTQTASRHSTTDATI